MTRSKETAKQYEPPKQTHRIKTSHTIQAELMKDPLAGKQELAERVGVSTRTIYREQKALRSNGFNYDDRIIALTDNDVEIIELAQMEVINRLRDPDQARKIRTGDLVRAAEVSHKRVSLATGRPTENVNFVAKILHEIDGLSK